MYSLLSLRTYFTSGETETRAWTIKAGMLAPQARPATPFHPSPSPSNPVKTPNPQPRATLWPAQAAGVIHTDFERGFIRAETVGYEDYVESGSEKEAKAAGKWRSEGKDYEVQEGDVLLFRFNV